MSLDFDLTKIPHDVCFDENGKMRPVTEALIFYTMIVDMGEITRKNAREFATRVRMHHQALGPLMANGYMITFRDVERHIGLRTNVFPTKTAKGFASKLGAMVRDRVSRIIEEEAKTPLTQMEESIRVQRDAGSDGGDDAAGS